MDSRGLFATGEQDILFAGEDIVNESCADLSSTSDIRHSRSMETFAANEIIGGGDNLLTTDVASCFSNHACSRPSLHIVHDSCVSRPMKLSKSSMNKGYHILNEYSIELLPNFYRVLFGAFYLATGPARSEVW